MSTTPQLRRVTDESEWSAACREFADMNYRQTWSYAREAAAAAGAECEFVLIERDAVLLGAAAVRVRRLPLIGGGLAYLAGGPLVRRYSEPGEPAAVLEALEHDFVAGQGLTLRMLSALGSAADNAALDELLRGHGYVPASRPRRYQTIAVDTARSADEIRASFSKNWRKKLKRGETRGLTLRISTDDDAMDDVVALHQELIERKGFNTDVDARLLRDAQRGLRGADRMTAILIEHDGNIAGMNLVSALGDTLTGIIGATTGEGAKRGGAYLLEWAAMNLARERGLARYDMGGFDPDGNPGVADFKNGTRGEVLVAAGPYEKCAGGIRPGIARLGERVYRAVRRRASSPAPMRRAG